MERLYSQNMANDIDPLIWRRKPPSQGPDQSPASWKTSIRLAKELFSNEGYQVETLTGALGEAQLQEKIRDVHVWHPKQDP